jgi:hypothetical protein
VRHLEREAAVVGQQDQALAVEVEAADGEQPAAHLRQEVDDALLLFVPRVGADDAGRLVEQHVDGLLGLHAAAVVAHFVVLRIDAHAERGDQFAVDLDAAADDQRVGGAAAAHAAHRQEVVEPDLAVTEAGARRRGRRDDEALLAALALPRRGAALGSRAAAARWPTATRSAATRPTATGPTATGRPAAATTLVAAREALARFAVFVSSCHQRSPGSETSTVRRRVGANSKRSMHAGTSAVSPATSCSRDAVRPAEVPSVPAPAIAVTILNVPCVGSSRLAARSWRTTRNSGVAINCTPPSGSATGFSTGGAPLAARRLRWRVTASAFCTCSSRGRPQS